MRKLLLAITAAAAVLSAGTLAAGRAAAMAVAPATGLQTAVEDASIMHDARTVCRHRPYTSGTRCWWVPGWGYRYRPWRYRRWRY